VQTIVPFHGMRTADLAEVMRQAGHVESRGAGSQR
jgi:hypothetical protein